MGVEFPEKRLAHKTRWCGGEAGRKDVHQEAENVSTSQQVLVNGVRLEGQRDAGASRLR